MSALRHFRQARQLRLRRAPRVPSGAFRKAHAPHVLPLVARVEAQIRAEFERMTALVLEEIGPILLAKGAKRDAVSLPELWRTLHSTLRPQAILKKLFNQVNAETDRALAARLPTLPIAAVVSNGPQLEERWIRKNVDLIQVEPRVQRAVEHVLAKPLAEGVRVEELKAQLQERLGIEARRAELIARDQTLKLAGQLQQARQTQAGIRRYVWTTSEDERVRPDHAKLDGTVQSWDAPPIVDTRTGRRAHPGGDFACRCNADPVLEEFSEPSLAAPLPPETELTPGFEPGAEPAEAEPGAEPEAEAAPEAPLELPEDITSAQAAFAAEQQAALEAEQARRAAAQQAEAEAERLRLEARIAEVRAAAEREAAAEAAVRAKAAAAANAEAASAEAAKAARKAERAAKLAALNAQTPEQAAAEATARLEAKRLERQAAAEAASQARRQTKVKAAAKLSPRRALVQHIDVKPGIAPHRSERIIEKMLQVKPRQTPALQKLELRAGINVPYNFTGKELQAGGYYDPSVAAIVMPVGVDVPGLEHALARRLAAQGAAAAERISVKAGESHDPILTTAVHEYGHHVHHTAGDFVDRLIYDSWKEAAPIAAARRAAEAAASPLESDLSKVSAEGAVSRYATENHHEFWAEAFASYHLEREWLAKFRPKVLALVERVLGLLQ